MLTSGITRWDNAAHVSISPVMEEGVEKRFDVSSLMSDRSASSVFGLALIQPSVILVPNKV